jgi:hypothetical protein
MSAFGAMGDPEREDLPGRGMRNVGAIEKDFATGWRQQSRDRP